MKKLFYSLLATATLLSAFGQKYPVAYDQTTKEISVSGLKATDFVANGLAHAVTAITGTNPTITLGGKSVLTWTITNHSQFTLSSSLASGLDRPLVISITNSTGAAVTLSCLNTNYISRNTWTKIPAGLTELTIVDKVSFFEISSDTALSTKVDEMNVRLEAEEIRTYAFSDLTGNLGTNQVDATFIALLLEANSGFDFTPSATVLDNALTPIYTNAIATNTTVRLEAKIVGSGPTNSYMTETFSLYRREASSASLVGTNRTIQIGTDATFTNVHAGWGISGNNAILYVKGMTNTYWQAWGRAFTSTNGYVAAATYLVSEDFEGVGDPGDDWEVGAGTPNYDYTADPILGSESLLITSGSYPYVEFTPQSTVEIFFAYRAPASFSNTPYICLLNDSTGAQIARFRILSDGRVRLYDSAGMSITQTTSIMSVNSEYFIWIDYTKGTGANGLLSFAFATTQTKPAAEINRSNYTATIDAGRLYPYLNVTGNAYYDKVRISTTDIGSNPD